MHKQNAVEDKNLYSGIYALCVRRPVLAIVLNLLLVVAGAAALLGVEIREMPNVDRPVITITTTYSGSPPEVVDAEVTSVIEEAVARTSGVSSISSTSSYGRSRVTVEFSDSVDVGEAANDIRDAVGGVTRNLPDDADTPTVVKADANAEPVMRATVTSSQMRVEDLSALVEDVIVDRIASVSGVASVDTYGSREPVFKIALDMTALSSRGLTPNDVRGVLEALAMDTSGGALETTYQELYVRAHNDIETAEDIAAVKINSTTRIRDVALVTYGPDDAASGAFINGVRAIALGIIRAADSNTIEISQDVRAVIAELEKQLPEHVEIIITADDAVFIESAISEVLISLLMATAIVIAIIMLFLGSWRVTLIPAVTVPVALMGAVVGIWLVGFSMNILTLLALLLATGMVVDDAIVVLENISKRVQKGEGTHAAAILGTKEVFFAVVSTTATLAAVFIPISFLSGSVGKLFSEFGFVLAICVLLSSFVALTLAPMMASRILKPVDAQKAARPSMLWVLIMKMGGVLARIYEMLLNKALKVPLLVVAISIGFGALGWNYYQTLPEQLTPLEDRSIILMMARTPQGSSLDYTRSKLAEIEDIAGRYVESGEAQNLMTIAGVRNSKNMGFLILPLKTWSERDRSQQEIVAEMNRAMMSLKGIDVFLIQPNTLGIRGAGEGLRFAVTGTNYDVLAEGAQALSQAMQDELGDKIGRTNISYDTTQPQLLFSVDRDRAEDLGLSPELVISTLRMLLDGSEVAELFVEDDGIPMIMESGATPLRSTRDLENLFVKAADGTMLPLSSIVSVKEEAVAPSLTRERQQRAVPISMSLNEGYDLSQSIEDMRRIAAEVLPPEVTITLLSEAAVLEQTSSNMLLTFGFAILIVFLVLSAQFESFLSATVILATVPFGLAAAVFAIAWTGGSLNVYSQIGMVLLVGIMAKNGILVVEFANQLREQGNSVRDAIHKACLQRLRPVMMTVISTVLGGVPLVLAFGAGAEARMELGWVIVGGLGFATVATLFVTPAAYLLLARFSTPRQHHLARVHEEMRAALQDSAAHKNPD
ncbi:efflux RND transporter permease subunit [Pseudovibrio sp. SPO723]|uniref:efflux RND transporter permease subunit n=1 Tax=Nesiotobacter zosterae TaxID=392721 RepID=UPI0029C2DF58|nr:efflux RND transporter permease subunit [Pseudovibrio sp. SPO723]MDX5593731.1 efflux RND transporter permease subunit [Pseudovibrio sp. SPO723]